MTNTANLDPALQVGSDPTMSHIANPRILIHADGGLATYDCYIDGNLIGRFYGDGYANCWVQSPFLTDGPHVFTFTEILPKPGNPTIPFNFGVDTVIPTTPVITSVYIYPVNAQGKYTLAIFGTAEPRVSGPVYTSSVQVFSGYSGLAGSGVTSTGTWRAVSVPVSPGTYTLVAKAFDESGNISLGSTPWNLVVGTPPIVTLPSAPVFTGVETRNVILSWSTPPDGGSPILGYRLYRDDILVYQGLLRTFSEDNISVGTKYIIQAYNNLGSGPYSNSFIVT